MRLQIHRLDQQEVPAGHKGSAPQLHSGFLGRSVILLPVAAHTRGSNILPRMLSTAGGGEHVVHGSARVRERPAAILTLVCEARHWPGAGGGDRTRIAGLEGRNSATEPHLPFR